MIESALLDFENVRKVYKDFELHVNLKVEPGYITGLIGPNGAGKTTAFKSALGLIHTDGGRLKVFGKPAEELATSDRENIGVVLADSGFSSALKVKELLPVLSHLYPAFSRQEFIRQCDRFEIPMEKKIGQFSTGMKRKLQVLAAVSHGASLLILDEPTAGMDVIARDQLLSLLREYMETDGRSILISSHISSDLEGFCDDIYLIHEGKILLHEETDRLLNQYGLLKVTKEQYAALDQRYILKTRKEGFGYSCLTDQKQFYMENYPQIIIERGSIDELILMMNRRDA